MYVPVYCQVSCSMICNVNYSIKQYAYFYGNSNARCLKVRKICLKKKKSKI